mmetsp:Transcript_12644/g.23427  ORF Transcript_12644/g.23427 Transcript_12644/m.23427 type:complete len:457 (+) Transcript_12644:103-1473(+)
MPSSNEAENVGDIAEPRHRVGPKGVSSGVSFRELPEPCFSQLKKVCLHYTEKCSGKYENNKMAARYVHQLASEVLFLLSGIAEEIQVHQDIAKLAEQRLGEWNTNFPESLKVIGSPHDIADVIKSQRNELCRLEEELLNERANKHRDMSHAMKSMDCQLHASRNGALNERHKLSMEYETLQLEMQQRLAAQEREWDESMAKLHEYYAAELAAKTVHYEALLAEGSKHMSSLVVEHQVETDALSQTVNDLKTTMSKQRETYKSELKKLQDRLDNQSDGNSVATDDMSIDDVASTESSYAETQSTAVTSAAGVSESTSVGGGGAARRVQEVSRKYKKRLRRVMNELTACHEQCVAKDSELAKLSEKLSSSLKEVALSHRKLNSLQECNEGLRRQMQRCCGTAGRSSEEGRGEFDKFRAECVVQQENLNVLQHSPHFLHHSYHQHGMKSKSIMMPHSCK